MCFWLIFPGPCAHKTTCTGLQFLRTSSLKPLNPTPQGSRRCCYTKPYNLDHLATSLDSAFWALWRKSGKQRGIDTCQGLSQFLLVPSPVGRPCSLQEPAELACFFHRPRGAEMLHTLNLVDDLSHCWWSRVRRTRSTWFRKGRCRGTLWGYLIG